MSAGRVSVLAIELSAVPESVAQARHRIMAFAQQHTDENDVLERIAIAFSEAFTNAVRHAYPADEPGDHSIGVHADVEFGTLEIVVVDDGRGIHAGVSEPGLGAGLGLIAQCADRFAIRERVPAGTEIWMRFELP
jgi:anti-sigma regulatory factor (Ser/Thr protein kinase)